MSDERDVTAVGPAPLGDDRRAVRTMLLRHWDPIGVVPDGVAPDLAVLDEYDCQIDPLLADLRAGHTAQEIADRLDLELRHHFGLDPVDARSHVFAERLVAWWERRATEPPDVSDIVS